MRPYIYIYLLLCFACGTPSTESDASTMENSEVTTPPPNEDDLITRLMIDLIAEPSTQHEREINAIINHAIDKGWNVQATSTGLYYEILSEGEGDYIQWGDYIETHYEGSFMDGKIFDSSRKRARPLQFYVGNMIDGWNEGLQKIRPKGKIRLLVPSLLAYGQKGLVTPRGDTLVAANEVLLFDIEVLQKLK